MTKKLTMSKAELEILYKSHSAVEIGRMYGVTSGAIYQRMEKMGIQRRTQSDAARMYEEIPKDTLIQLYIDKTQAEIAELYGVSQEWVRKLIKKYGIKSRPKGSRRVFNISKERLATLYTDHSMREIAYMFDVGETVVFKRIKEYGIKLDKNHREKSGKVFSESHLKNMQLSQIGLKRGENSPKWKGGITSESRKGRSRAIYQMWKKKALQAANNTCKNCGAVKGDVCGCCGQKVVVHVHHIKPYASNPAERYSDSNAEVLCAKCHNDKHFKKIG